MKTDLATDFSPSPPLTPAYRWLLALVCILMFAWAIPGTIGLRLALTVALLAVSLWQCRRTPIGESFRTHRALWLTYGALTAWIIGQALLFGINQEIVFKEIWGQWFRSGVTGLIGFLVAILIVRHSPHRGGPILAMVVALTLTLHVGLHDAYALWLWWQKGQIAFMSTPLVANYAGISFITNLLASLLCAEIMSRLLYRHRYLPLSWPGLGFLIALCIFATYSASARHGTLGFLALLTSCALVTLIAKRREINVALLAGIAAVVLAGIGTLGWLSFKSDPRWLTLAETVPLALDTEHHLAWLDPIKYPFPKLSSGEPVGESNYARIAWAKEAVLAIVRNPLGVGFGRDAFGRAELLVHPDFASSKHCHSGLLNLTVGIGLPGLILWLCFLGILVKNGWQAFFRRENPAGLLLLFLVSGFTLRSIVDGNLQDHMFEQFMFLAMLFNVLANEDRKAA